MTAYRKREVDPGDIRRLLEPGPVILVSSMWKGRPNVMTMGWHMMMEEDPVLVGTYVWTEDYTRTIVEKTKECVINIPTVELLDTAVRIGNSTGEEIDKFAAFGLTPAKASKVKAPLIRECYASFECKLFDKTLARKRSLFIWKVVKAHVASSPKYPRTFHYRGDGVFMISGANVSRKRLFEPGEALGHLETLSNMIWRAFAGSQRHLTAGTDRVRRFAAGYSPLLAFAEPSSADFQEIAPFCDPGERFYCGEWTGAEPDGWTIELDTTMCPMLWNASPPSADDSLEVVRLRAEHVPQAMALTELTRPGPFGERTIELGEWYGVFEDGALVAMAGERLQDGALREISGICTHPEFQGRGLARRMTELMIGRVLARGETPFLHVAARNTRAVELYKKMGFVVTREVSMRIVVMNKGV